MTKVTATLDVLMSMSSTSSASTEVIPVKIKVVWPKVENLPSLNYRFVPTQLHDCIGVTIEAHGPPVKMYFNVSSLLCFTLRYISFYVTYYKDVSSTIKSLFNGRRLRWHNS